MFAFETKLIISMDLCKKASELAHNVIFNIILVVVIIISTTAIVVGIWTMFKRTNHFAIF
ncbi:hypothetical protein X798_05020 [Onchocerca flexuosa]|uniref:Uncharacterized protein n=1 Tax=Onchocerca flexuosa TaxID=387005 RepID=A0A238BSP6_9BILA|nr:hypothetical protein X798_05020 [Onchocerca flexuosa]